MIWMFIVYILILLAIGLISKGAKTPTEYFVANRSFGKTILFFTMIATNFSAFFFMGFAANAYRLGLTQYTIMAVGTALMPIMFAVIGFKVLKLGKKHDLVTMPQLIEHLSKSKTLKNIYLTLLCGYTLPYLGVQAIGAGYIINMLTGYDPITMAVFVLATISTYVLVGGMKGSGWTDALQGVIMFFAMGLAVIYVGNALGGIRDATQNLLVESPKHILYPPIGDATILFLSFTILWVFADPMFPHLFTRFYTAKDENTMWTTIKLYPLVVAILFAAPVLIGTWAWGAGLTAASDDMILLEAVKTFSPPWVTSTVLIGALAALMSTADSQLLSLTTMLAKDLNFKDTIKTSKKMTVALFILTSIYITKGYQPAEGIFNTLMSTTFSGLATLAPSTIALLYGWAKSKQCILSILAGQGAIALIRFQILPNFAKVEGVTALIIAIVTLYTAKKLKIK